jgi:type I site-specific restriction endonuclease
MTQLQQMLQGQQQLLQESQALLEMRAAQEKLLQERQAAIQRLAGQQRSLKQLAEQMQKDLKDNKRILGRVDKMVEEMEEVIRDLEGGVLDEQTIRNEERIVSRLLDANRSVHSRDYEKKRLSVSAQDVFSNTAGGERAKPVSRQLREEIRRAMLLKAPGEFEDLIRLYFRALAEEAPPTANEK